MLHQARRARIGLALRILAAAVLLSGLVLGAGSALVQWSGRTPAELVAYAERRLEGHPKLQLVSVPVFGLLENYMGQPSEKLQAIPIAIPRPGQNVAAASPGLQPSADSRLTIRVGPSRAIKRIAEAARLAPEGAVVEIDPGDYFGDVAVWERKSITIRGLGDRVRVIAAGANAEGKGTWVVRGGVVTIENIEFVGARVGDGNGAGIRLETGQLLVRNCVFLDNQMGILTANDRDIRLVVEGSEFGFTARSDHYTHNLYAGAIASLRLTGNYFHHGDRGHLLKSRALHNRVEYNRFTDESGGQSSYEIDLPNGGQAEIVGNVVQQGANSGNSVIISYGEEGYSGSKNQLLVVHNTLVNDMRFGGTFVRMAPGASFAVIRNNAFVGPGRLTAGFEADVFGNWRGNWKDLVRPSRQDYRLSPDAQSSLAGKALGPVPEALVPRFEYLHPRQTRPVQAKPGLPGALQNQLEGEGLLRPLGAAGLQKI